MDAGGPDVVRLTALVHGHVQMVGYREFCRRSARALGREGGAPLRGYARNLANGSTVEVVAEGPRASLERLLGLLNEGPGAARVSKVDASWGAATSEFDGFVARY